MYTCDFSMYTCDFSMMHYRRGALTSARSTRQSLKNTRQRRLGKQCIGKAFFAEYFFSDTRQRKVAVTATGWRRRRICRVSWMTLGKGVTFAECLPRSTRQRIHLCRVPSGTLGKEPAREGPHVRLFAECSVRHSAKPTSLPSASDITLGKVPKPVPRFLLFAECYDPDKRYLFYLFFVFHPHKQKISHIYHIYTSQT
jgi:hypothetical protein